VTFGDDGRWVWLEVDPSLMGGTQGPPMEEGPRPLPPPGATPPSGPPVAPAGPPKPKAEPPAPIGPAAPSPGAKTQAPKTESKGAAK
jgi:hypothetical protein